MIIYINYSKNPIRKYKMLNRLLNNMMLIKMDLYQKLISLANSKDKLLIKLQNYTGKMPFKII